MPGPQLVVPATVPRYALNAANARWGSLFDALYGTDALPLDHELEPGYDERRGAQVIDEADRLLDRHFPLADAQPRRRDRLPRRLARPSSRSRRGSGRTGLADPAQFVGHRRDEDGTLAGVLLRRNGLHVELAIDRSTQVGEQHHAGRLRRRARVGGDHDRRPRGLGRRRSTARTRSAPTAPGSGCMTGELSATFVKDGQTVTRRLNGDRSYVGPDGTELTLPGRSLLLVRNVGHHMTLDAVRTADGEPVLEEVLDALVSAVAALHDLRRARPAHATPAPAASTSSSPRCTGPDEVALSVELFAAVEEALGLAPSTIKIGIMDEEKRTSVNLEACIARAADRVIFVNTGFLDRTGDEIHTDFEAGPMVAQGRPEDPDLAARPTRTATSTSRCGPGSPGSAQIGKGMWAKPAGHARRCSTPRAPTRGPARTPPGCPRRPPRPCTRCTTWRPTCWPCRSSWRQRATRRPARACSSPRCCRTAAPLSDEQKRHELETNAQSILGYVVRWVGLGHRLLDGARPRRRRSDGGPGDPADLQPADRQLAAPRGGRRGAGARDVRPDGRAGRRAERRRARLPPDERRPRRAARRSRPPWSWSSPGAPSPTATPSGRSRRGGNGPRRAGPGSADCGMSCTLQRGPRSANTTS